MSDEKEVTHVTQVFDGDFGCTFGVAAIIVTAIICYTLVCLEGLRRGDRRPEIKRPEVNQSSK